jgi:hypothetical protein
MLWFRYDGEPWNRSTLLDENSLITERLIMQEATYWRRKLWDKAGGALDLSYRFAADYELWLRFFRFTQLYTVDALVAGFRSHGPEQRSQIFRRDYNAECKKAMERENNATSENPHIDTISPPLISNPLPEGYIKSGVKSISDQQIEFFRPSRDTSFPPALSPVIGQICNDTQNAIERFDNMDKIMAYINQADAHMAGNDLASAREAIKEALSHAAGNPQLAEMLTNMLTTLESH